MFFILVRGSARSEQTNSQKGVSQPPDEEEQQEQSPGSSDFEFDGMKGVGSDVASADSADFRFPADVAEADAMRLAENNLHPLERQEEERDPASLAFVGNSKAGRAAALVPKKGHTKNTDLEEEEVFGDPSSKLTWKKGSVEVSTGGSASAEGKTGANGGKTSKDANKLIYAGDEGDLGDEGGGDGLGGKRRKVDKEEEDKKEKFAAFLQRQEEEKKIFLA